MTIDDIRPIPPPRQNESGLPNKVDALVGGVRRNTLNILEVSDGSKWSPVYAEEGWVSSGETWTYASADSPTFTLTTPGDKTYKYSPGMRVKYTQKQALTSLWHMENNANDSVGSNNGVATNVTFNAANAKFGSYGAGFNGATSKIVITDAANLKPTGNFTIGAWVKSTSSNQMVFQSYSLNPNRAGIFLYMDAAGKMRLYSGRNTGVTQGTDFEIAQGATVINDGSFHFVVGTWNGTTLKVYVDGLLDGSTSWSNAPAYAATNYVRIGCQNETGVDVILWNGSIDEVFLINGYALGETNILGINLQNIALATPLPLIKFGLISAWPKFTSPSTTITVYAGTDYVMANSAITNTMFSSQKSPFGFPTDPSRWSVQVLDGTARSQAGPVQNTWYNLGSQSITVPIGVWRLLYKVRITADRAAAGVVGVTCSLSTANNSESDKTFSSGTVTYDVKATGTAVFTERPLSLSAKTIYYLITRTIEAGIGNIYNENDVATLDMRAISAHL